MLQGINWHVFTLEEQNNIKEAIGRGDRDNLACLIEGVNMDLEKEAELQKIVDRMTPDDEDFVSEVDGEVSRDFLEGVAEADKTPEIEEEFQKKLDEEREAFVKNKKETKRKKNSKKEEAPIEEETPNN